MACTFENNLNEYISFCSVNGREPVNKGNKSKESKMAQWAATLRMHYRKGKLDTSRTELVLSRCPKLLEIRGIKQDWYVRFNQIITFINSNRRPPACSEYSEKDEKSMYNWLHSQVYMHRSNKLDNDKAKLLEDMAPGFLTYGPNTSIRNALKNGSNYINKDDMQTYGVLPFEGIAQTGITSMDDIYSHLYNYINNKPNKWDLISNSYGLTLYNILSLKGFSHNICKSTLNLAAYLNKRLKDSTDINFESLILIVNIADKTNPNITSKHALMHALMDAYFESISDKDRYVIEEKLFKNRTYSEISKEIGCSKAMVGMRLKAISDKFYKSLFYSIIVCGHYSAIYLLDCYKPEYEIRIAKYIQNTDERLSRIGISTILGLMRLGIVNDKINLDTVKDIRSDTSINNINSKLFNSKGLQLVRDDVNIVTKIADKERISDLCNKVMEKSLGISAADLSVIASIITSDTNPLDNANEKDFKSFIIDSIRIEALHFSNRTYNCLLKSAVRTIRDLKQLVLQDSIRGIKGFGDKCYAEVVEKLENLYTYNI